MRTLRFLASAALLLMPASVFGQAQSEKPTVAVLPFNYTSLTPGVDGKALGASITDMVVTEFAKSPAVKLVDRQMVQDLLMKQNLLVSGRLSDEDAMRAGRLLGAQYIIAGSVVLAGGEARLDIRIVDPETSQFPKPPFKERGKQDKILDLVEQLVANFTTGLKLPNRATVLAESVIPVDASLAYSRGLDYEKRGKKDLARLSYEKAVKIFPNHVQAKAALARVR